MKIQVFWDVTLCCLTSSFTHFEDMILCNDGNGKANDTMSVPRNWIFNHILVNGNLCGYTVGIQWLAFGVINNLICVNNIFRLLRWNVSRNAFQLTKTLDTKESCSCIHFARHSIIVGCNKFFEIDIRDFSMEGMNKFWIFQNGKKCFVWYEICEIWISWWLCWRFQSHEMWSFVTGWV